ncbi:MAG TPA: nucleotidyltransferase family protein [Mobilitalea sp.]|nr:nucleotidyltransferase family protein [Mobilitalea sp.]
MNDQYNIKVLLTCVNKAIHGETGLNEDINEADWDRIYELAKRNKLATVLIPFIQKSSENLNIPVALLADWKKEALGYMLAESRKYMVLRQILQLAKEEDITFILFKGCVLADMYPNYLSRITSDTDIFVYERDKKKAVRIFENMGFRKSTISSKDSVYKYILDSIFYKVELHFSLWEDYKSDKIRLMDEMRLTKEETLLRVKACGMDVVTLGYEEHLIFQMFHIIKHFSLQGVTIRYLVDITLFVNRFGEQINLQRFWEKMKILNYDKFCENFFYLCMQYLGMSSKIMEGRQAKIIGNVDDFIVDLMNVGISYEKRTADWHLVGILQPYFLGELVIPKSRFGRTLRILFPSSEVIPFAYARKYKILLPVAWIHRCFYFLVKLPTCRKEIKDAKEKMHLAEIRLSLMQSLGLAGGGNRE